MRGAVLPHGLDRSGVLAGVLAGVLDHATPTEGEVWHKQKGGCATPLVHVSPSVFGLFVVERRTRTAPAVRETTGATPPFSPLARFGEGGGVPPGVPPSVPSPPAVVGVAPVRCIPAGRLPGPRAGRATRPTERRDD